MKQILYFLIRFSISVIWGCQYAYADECLYNYGDLTASAWNWTDVYTPEYVGIASSQYDYPSVDSNELSISGGTSGVVSDDGVARLLYVYMKVKRYSNPEHSGDYSLICKYKAWLSNTQTHDVCEGSSDSDDDGLPDECDMYPDDPTDYQVRLFSTQETSSGTVVRECYITDRDDLRCFGSEYDSSLTDVLKIGQPWQQASTLCAYSDYYGPDYNERDDDGDGVPNGQDPSDPISPTDNFNDSDPVPDSENLGDGDPLTPSAFDDPANIPDNDGDGTGGGDYARTQDVQGLSQDQQARLEFLNSQQNLRNENLKAQIRDVANFLDSSEKDRDQVAEDNTDKRHNDLKQQLDNKFSALDNNQERRNTSLKTSIDSLVSNTKLTYENLDIISDSLGLISESIPSAADIGQAVRDNLSESLGALSESIPSAADIGQAVSDSLVDPTQTIDTSITDNISDLDKTETLTAIKTRYSDRYDLFINTLKNSDLFTVPFAIFTGPSGSGSSIQTVEIGAWGQSSNQTATIDFSEYDNVWNILSAVLLMLTSFACFKILVLKKA